MRTIGAFMLSVLLMLRLQGQENAIDTLAAVPAHPRLLMTAAEEEAIRAAVRTDKIWRGIHQAILHRCDSLITLAPSERVMEGIRLDRDRLCLYRIFYLSYAWRITHEKKYFDQAEKELMAICHFKDWNPTHYLDVVELTMAAAIGYDWLYNELSGADRETLRSSIINKGILTSYDTSYHAYRKWLSVTNNWNQVCNTGISYGAMAIYDTDPAFARQVINRSINSIVISMKRLESKSCAGPRLVPGATISLPVEKMATRMRRRTSTPVKPRAAMSATSWGLMRCPACRTTCPAAISSPAGRVLAPRFRPGGKMT